MYNVTNFSHSYGIRDVTWEGSKRERVENMKRKSIFM